MNKIYLKGLSTLILLIALHFNQIIAQPFTDNFGGPLLTTNNNWTSWQSNLMFGYLPLTVSAGPVFGNQWTWSNGVGLNPAAPIPFSAGGMIKFNSRNGGLAPAGAIDTGCAYIATPPLDFSSRAGAAANVSFYLNHESYAGSTGDSVAVYASNTDQLTGAVRLGSVWVDPAGYGTGWVQSTMAIPNLAQFNGCDNVVIMFVAYTWTSYRNIYVDNIYVDRFTSPQTVTSATLTNQNTLNVSLSSVNNQIVAVNVKVCGSTTPKQIDSIMFNPTGTNISNDVLNAKLFYTGNSPTFSTATQVFATVNNPPILNVTYNNSLGFGSCAAPVTLVTGDNYFWLTYDIKPTAFPGDIVDADFLGIVTHSPGCIAGGGTTIGPVQTLPGGRPIGITYTFATYSVGTAFAGYTINDFIGSVAVTSTQAGNPLFNQEHDITSWAGCTGTAGQNCNRHSPHPPDYTLFPPTNSGATKDRSLNLKLGQGIRTSTPPDKISIAAGTWFSANFVRAWIDFNGDGDFNDNYIGVGGTIFESIVLPNAFSLSDNQAIGSLGSLPGAFPPGKIADDWNEWNIQVPDVGELPTVGGGSGGPATKAGSVRMRVREVFASSTFGPSDSQVFGETEDYDIALVESCPAPGTFVCRWISGGANPNDWFTAANWCPSIPTTRDRAEIVPNGAGTYPIITSNQLPVCYDLKIFSGANVTIDAPDVLSGAVLVPNTGKLKAYNNVEIGEAQNTAAQLKVNSTYSNTVVTGVPSASGNTAISPFRNDRQDSKIQFIYTPAELAIMGLKSGDLLSSLTFQIRSAVALPAGNLGNFTVKIWQLDNPYTYPAVMVPNTEVAVNSTAPTILPSTGGIVSTTCYGPAVFAIPAIVANVTTPITIPFTTKCLLNNTKYLCIEISRDNPFALGSAYPVLYESSLLRSCLTLLNASNSISANSNALNITGPGTAPGAANLNINKGIMDNGTFVNGGLSFPFAYITGASYVFRPTSTIGVTRQYSKYPIEVGGNWVNNSASGLPLGFVGGWSTVKMDHTNLINAVWYPNNDVDTISGSEITTFNELQLNDVNGFRMNVQGIANGNQGLIIDTLLDMTLGQLNLNQHRADIKNPAIGAITRTAGSILSENTNNYNKVQWTIGTTTGAHLIPFGATAAAADYVPFTFNLVSGDAGNVTVSTYRTNAANTPVPSLPVAVNNLFNSTCVDNSANTVDRFWQIDRSTVGAVSVNATFGYTASENTTGKPFTSIVAQRYDGAAAKACGLPTGRWSNPTGVAQTAVSQSQSNVGYLSVTANGVTQFSPWALSIIETPLPLQLLDFNAKLIDEKVKVYWTVTNEQNIKDYEVYKSYNKDNFNLMAVKKAVGPLSGGLTNYTLWDGDPIAPVQYYQLKTTDNSGQISYSKLALVTNKQTSFGITQVNMADANNHINLQFVSDNALPCHLDVIDMFGRTVFSQDLGTINNGINSIQIPAAFVDGVYTISISNNEKRDSRTFVK